jgi:hypothetical protein
VSSEAVRHEPDVSVFALQVVARELGADEADPLVAQSDKVLQPEDGARPVVDVHGRKLEWGDALPQSHDGQHRIPQIGQEARLVLQLADHDQGIAVAGLEDGG